MKLAVTKLAVICFLVCCLLTSGGGKFTEILSSEDMTLDDLTQASLTFIRAPEAHDDYSTICRAQLVGRNGASVNAAVDFMGNTRVWPP